MYLPPLPPALLFTLSASFCYQKQRLCCKLRALVKLGSTFSPTTTLTFRKQILVPTPVFQKRKLPLYTGCTRESTQKGGLVPGIYETNQKDNKTWGKRKAQTELSSHWTCANFAGRTITRRYKQNTRGLHWSASLWPPLISIARSRGGRRLLCPYLSSLRFNCVTRPFSVVRLTGKPRHAATFDGG